MESTMNYLYAVKFKKFKDEVKIGKSSNIFKRLKTQIADHGILTFCKVWESDNKQDVSSTEASIKKQYKNLISRDLKLGATEFIKLENSESLTEIVNKIDSAGLLRSKIGLKDFKFVKGSLPRSKKYLEIRKNIEELQIIDAIILTPIIAGRVFPKSLKDFRKMCGEIGQSDSGLWIGESMFEIACQLKEEYPDGILQLYNKG